jgi:Fur family ferric uptake transcriptional regulator
MADNPKSRCPKEFFDFVVRRGLRQTPQRRAIVELVFNTRQHFTAEQLYDWARARDASVSRATVYRTLTLLTESGLIQELELGKEVKYYDPNYAAHPDHNHIICLDCGNIIEFDSPEIDQQAQKIAQDLGFAVKSRRLQILATCDELQKTGHCSRKAD